MFGSGDALSDGAPSRLVLEELLGVAASCLVLVVLYHMAHRLFWCLGRFIRWRIFSDAGASSMDGAVLCGASGVL
jgi:hypothetical protein